MADFRQRAQSPLTSEEWERLDKITAVAASEQRVGRRVLDLFGPIGAGHQFVPRLSLAGVTTAAADLAGQGGAAVSVAARSHLPLTIIHKDFTLHWRDVETARQSGLPLDLGAAAAAAALCAAREDDLIFHGDKPLGIEGLTTVAGHRSMTRRDWGLAGHAFLDIVEATDHMAAAGLYPPYALVCSPNLYACLLRVAGAAGVLELSQAREICTAGVFRSAHIKSALLLAVGPQNFDLVVGQDLTVAYTRTENMDYVFRVLETLALRVKRPAAICSLVPRTASPTHRVRRGVPEEATGGGD
jgi:uncharacterized linocin/CFP29 family protein